MKPAGTRNMLCYIMGLATKSTPRFTKSPSLVSIGLVLTEVQTFKNVKNLQRNV